MKLTTPFTALRNATSNIWRMHALIMNYPKKEREITGIKNV